MPTIVSEGQSRLRKDGQLMIKQDYHGVKLG